jgi:hypothetical protein
MISSTVRILRQPVVPHAEGVDIRAHRASLAIEVDDAVAIRPDRIGAYVIIVALVRVLDLDPDGRPIDGGTVQLVNLVTGSAIVDDALGDIEHPAVVWADLKRVDGGASLVTRGIAEDVRVVSN